MHACLLPRLYHSSVTSKVSSSDQVDKDVILAALVEAGERPEEAQSLADGMFASYIQLQGNLSQIDDAMLKELGIEKASVRAQLLDSLKKCSLYTASLIDAKPAATEAQQQQQQQQQRLAPPAKPPRISSQSSSAASSLAETVRRCSSSDNNRYSDDFEAVTEEDEMREKGCRGGVIQLIPKEAAADRVTTKPSFRRLSVDVGDHNNHMVNHGSPASSASSSSSTTGSPHTASLTSPFIAMDSKLSTPTGSPQHMQQEERLPPSNARAVSSPGPHAALSPTSKRAPSLTSVSQNGGSSRSGSASEASRKTAEKLKLRLIIQEQEAIETARGGGERGGQGHSSRKSFGGALTGRRIRPNHWKLGNKIGKGSFGQVCMYVCM